MHTPHIQKKLRTAVLLSLCAIFPLKGHAQDKVLRLWPSGAPGAKTDTTYHEKTTWTDIQLITNVSDPTITVYLPAKEKATGTAVLICPGGGYVTLAYSHEGTEMAEWFRSHGVAAILLKYRLPHASIMEDIHVAPLQDAQEAMRVVRRHAQAWNIDPHKIGVMGFSAGGHLAATLSTHYADKVYTPADSTGARPDFSLLIYPVISMQAGVTHGGSRYSLLGPSPTQELVDRFSNELQVNAQTPPAFLVHSTNDDVVPVENSILYLTALNRNHIAAELHIYETGGHGYGMTHGKGTHLTWPSACLAWLKLHQYL